MEYQRSPQFWEVMDSEVINHLDHPHQLKLVHMNRYAKCEVCETDVSKDLAFACGRCYYVVCKKCARLPSKMKHPFHPEHSIILLEKNSPIGCKACGLICYGYLYDCEQCGFCLDLKCATLMPTQKGNTESQETAVMKHPHPLFVCDYPKDSDREFGCRLCYESLGKDDLVYVCLECICLMDKNCAGQPSEMDHPFHPEHHVSLFPSLPKNSSTRCFACSSYLFFKDVVYSCSTCSIYIDFQCASLMPVLDSDKKLSLIQSRTHPHPLIECYSSRKKFHRNCYGCGLPFKDAIYACLECRILLHKSCADLPRKISHHFHPQHPLILHENSVDNHLYRSFNCGGCGNGHGDFVYICQSCDFLLDVRCATADLLIVKSAIHQHSLALVDFPFSYCRCGICYRAIDKNGFRCVPCNFNIHEHCHPSLPKTIKHECHCDPLTFTTKRIKDYPDEDEDDYDYDYDYDYRHKEFYCNACEDTRELPDPTYYCSECHFVAHIRCVFSEILPHLEITTEKLVQEVENIKSEPVMAADGGGDNSETKGGDSNEVEEEDRKLQLAQELSKQIITLKEEIDGISKRIDMLMDKRNEHIRLLQHKLDQKTHLTGKRQILPGYRQPIYIGYDESAKVTVSHIF